MIFEGHFSDLLTVVTLCAQIMRDRLAITKFLVSKGHFSCWNDFVPPTNCEHDTLKTNEPTLMPIGTSCPRGKRIKRSSSGVKRSKVKVVRGQR